jgi:transcriptional regulator with XRE-family HTH domain
VLQYFNNLDIFVHLIYNLIMIEFDGKKLKDLRRSRNLSQKELERAIFGIVDKVPQNGSPRICNYETGVATPPGDVILALLRYFNAKPADLCRTPE